MDFEKKIYPPDIGMSPQFAMRRFRAAIAKYGQQRVLSESRFQKAREIWASGAFLIGLSKITQKTYWVAPEYYEQTPDTYGMSFVPHSKYKNGKLQEIHSIEVSEYEQHADGGLLGTIKRKLSGKVYPDFYVLLIYAKRPGESVNLEEVFQTLSTETFSVSEIFLVASVSAGTKYVYTTVSLYRQRAQVSYCLDDELAQATDQCEMISWSRGIGDAQPIEQSHVLKLPDL